MPDISTFIAPLLSAGLTWLSRGRQPKRDGRQVVGGLQAPVEIKRDRWGIPHLYAECIPDLFFGQGWVHAQDRLWQMEFNRRVVAGRLAEVLGPVAVPLDRWMRTLTMRRVAEAEASLLNAETRAVLEAYAAGVNAGMAHSPLPVEFTLLRHQPEPWTVADTLGWIKMMSWALSVNWETELLRAQLVARLGAERAAELEPPYFDRWPCVIPAGVDYTAIGVSALERSQAARSFTGPPAGAGLGSNNWAVAGWRTASGHPLLANDMHLPMTAPAIWYENHLAGGGLNVTGVTFPGIPGVVAGHNGHVAWGFTNGFPDVQDLYMEHLRREDGRVLAEYNGTWYAAELLHEAIHVKGGATVVEEVIVTRHGPIINRLAPDLAGEQPLALRWTSFEPDTMMQGVLEMNRARNCQELRQALRHWAAPVQNVVYADVEGNIAYSFPGRMPIRAKGDGRMPVPGWTDEYEWVGYIPFEQLPHLYNPPQGYIATANNRVLDDDAYPYYLGRETTMGDRAQRIVELIESRSQIDIPFIRRMQFDQVSPSARVIARHLGQLTPDDPELAAVAGLMRGWDGALLADSPAAAVYQVFIRRIIRLMLSSKLGDGDKRQPAGADLAERYAGRGPTPVLAERSMFGERSLEWLQHTLADPHAHWFDLGQGETRDDVLRLALLGTVEYLKAELGPAMSDWAWGKLHKLTYRHNLGGVKLLERLFNRGPYPLGGDGTTLWATTSNAHDLNTDDIVGPPFRMIVDLGDVRNSLGLLAPGQSGRPGERHYDDQAQAWFSGEYHPMLFTQADVERATQHRLWLVPPDV